MLVAPHWPPSGGAACSRCPLRTGSTPPSGPHVCLLKPHLKGSPAIHPRTPYLQRLPPWWVGEVPRSQGSGGTPRGDPRTEVAAAPVSSTLLGTPCSRSGVHLKPPVDDGPIAACQRQRGSAPAARRPGLHTPGISVPCVRRIGHPVSRARQDRRPAARVLSLLRLCTAKAWPHSTTRRRAPSRSCVAVDAGQYRIRGCSTAPCAGYPRRAAVYL